MTESMSSEAAKENDKTKPNGLYEALCELYGWDPKCRPEEVIEAAWKAVPRCINSREERDEEVQR